MYLSSEYLKKRHQFWIERISDAGIWDKANFLPVEFIVRNKSKSYLGKFVRKYEVGIFRKRFADSIVLYKKNCDSSVREIDEILVHEMIHQYIFQNNLRDTSSHGRLFRWYMAKINSVFKDEITLSIKSNSNVERGEGNNIHLLLVLQFEGEEILCCKINKKKILYYNNLIREGRLTRKLISHGYYISRDKYFESFTTCNSRLRGKIIALSEFPTFREEYKLKELVQTN